MRGEGAPRAFDYPDQGDESGEAGRFQFIQSAMSRTGLPLRP